MILAPIVSTMIPNNEGDSHCLTNIWELYSQIKNAFTKYLRPDEILIIPASKLSSSIFPTPTQEL
jgi:hypothetical protein